MPNNMWECKGWEKAYKEETKKEPYELLLLDGDANYTYHPTKAYVKWLEKKLNKSVQVGGK